MRVKDGEIQEDTSPYEADEITDNEFSLKKTSMAFGSAIKSSFKKSSYEEIPYIL